MGGGLGIVYREGEQPATIESCVRLIADAVKEEARNLNYPLPKLVLEPGRSLVGEAGTTLYTIGSIKEIPGIRCYVAVNGGMADNPRVALYQAQYEGLIANKADQKREKLVTITGKCCESGDMLIWDIQVAPPQPGDIMAIFSTGAYNYSMASNYNRLTRPAMVIVQNGQADLIIARETYQDLISLDRIPARIQKLAAVSGNRS
jgi:diaminopimelate decarboxylase